MLLNLQDDIGKNPEVWLTLHSTLYGVIKVTWPHELVYMTTGYSAVYEDLSVTLVVS